MICATPHELFGADIGDELLVAGVDDDTARALRAAVNRLFAARFKQRHLLRTARQAAGFVASRRRMVETMERRHGAVFTLKVPVFGNMVTVTDPQIAKQLFTANTDDVGNVQPNLSRILGSGSVFAKSSLKKLWRPGLSEDEAVAITVEALYDAADDDSATGGPDLDPRRLQVVFDQMERAAIVHTTIIAR